MLSVVWKYIKRLRNAGIVNRARGQNSNFICSLVVKFCRIVSPILVCPVIIHPMSACSWIGFLHDRPEHVSRDHRGCLVNGTTLELGNNSAVMMSVSNELFLCYSLLDQGVIYCFVVHASCYTTCTSRFWYTTEYY